ncbi:MAG TPA: hypothetical protein VK797_05020 [Tepidisphaeraceae bacterium]|nr:hypothetical protein [Tepidisphaeraceae bacterium]
MRRILFPIALFASCIPLLVFALACGLGGGYESNVYPLLFTEHHKTAFDNSRLSINLYGEAAGLQWNHGMRTDRLTIPFWAFLLVGLVPPAICIRWDLKHPIKSTPRQRPA